MHWSFLQPSILRFCEFHRDGWISEPANTFSNIPFVLVGFYLLWKHFKNKHLQCFGIAAVVVGITSFFYHATSSRIGEKIDIASMCLLVGSTFLFNLERLQWIEGTFVRTKVIVISILSLLMMVEMDGIKTQIFDSLLLGTLILEVIIAANLRRRKKKRAFSYKFLFFALGNHAFAFSIWLLDFHRVFCNPTSVIQGHAIWHILGAITFLFVARFYSQFFI